MPESLDDRVAAIQKRLNRIDAIFWTVAAVAAIFGITGAFGYKLIEEAKTEIKSLQTEIVPLRDFVDNADKFIRDAKEEISQETHNQISTIKPTINDLAADAVNDLLTNRVAFSRTDGHITSLGMHSNVSLSVKKGDIVHATYTGTAEASDFYFRIVKTHGSATALLGSAQLIRNAEQRWQPIATQEIFRVDADGELQLSVEFFKSDITGKVKVFGSSLVAVNAGKRG